MYSISAEQLQEATPKLRAEQNLRAIETLKQLQEDNDTPTQEQLHELGLFNGWGSCPGIFTPMQPWEFAAQERLKQLLGVEEYEQANKSIVNAHYTSAEVISAVWGIVEKLGFKNGRVLEPSMGLGHFFGLMPHQLRKHCNTELFGVELEPTPAAIAKHLYPEARVYSQGFETVELPDNYFDLVIGNVPFGNYSLHDPKYDALDLSIHNYFIAKSADLLREGGLMAVITSTYTLDAKNKAFREYLASKLELIKAIRLPSTAFKASSGTEVSADILIFQKRTQLNLDLKLVSWIEIIDYRLHPSHWGTSGNSQRVTINECYYEELVSRQADIYYKDSKDSSNYKYCYQEPHQLLGTPSINKLYGNGFALAGDGRNLTTSIERVANTLTPCFLNANTNENTKTREAKNKILLPADLQNVKDSAFVILDNKLYTRDGAYLITSTVDVNKVRASQQLHNLILSVIEAQKHLTDADLAFNQLTLKNAYDSFVDKYGKLNDAKNVKELGCSPEYYLVRSLERVVNKRVVGLADIFNKRVISNFSLPTKASNAEDAIANSLNAKGKLDYAYMSSLLSVNEDALIKELAEKEVIYFNPAKNEWEQRDKYLSGNVYQKLQDALKHELVQNIEALKKVQPLPALPNSSEDIKIKCIQALNLDWESFFTNEEQSRILSKKIDAKLGTIWIPASYYKQFAREVLGIVHLDDIKYVAPPVASWYVDPPKSSDYSEYGTENLSSAEILAKTLNLQEIKVSLYKDSEFDPIASQLATIEAQGKATIIKQEFLNWLWMDEERCVELCRIYNTKINVYRSRKYDGSWLQLPGLNPKIKLRPWQLNAIARIIENPATFLAHDVGLGKTFVMIAGIMELRRLGIVKKPLLVCLNGTEQQIYDDFKKLYPLANVIIAGKLSNTEDRKLFTSSIKTGDFDCTILTHSQFFELTLSKEYQVQFLNQERELILEFLSCDENNNPKSITHKMLRSALEQCEDKISDAQFPELQTMTVVDGKNKKRKLRKDEKKEIKKGKNLDALNLKILDSKRKHDHLDFEGLTDCLVIDEIHQMKNLAILTKLQNIRGIPTSYSQRATDTYTKLLYVLDNLINASIKKVTTRSGRAVGATGTIFSNTIAEIYNWQRMFQLPLLKELGIDFFDAWVSQFAEPVASAEISPEGTYKVKTRLKKFSNLSVLHATMSQFVDIVTFDAIANNKDYGLIRPEPLYIDVIAPASESQLQFLRTALERATAIRNREVDPTIDNFLKLTTDLTKAALSMRLLGDKKEAPESKLHDVGFNILQVYKATEEFNGTQLAFCDFSTPKNVVKTTAKIKNLLINNGVSREDVKALTPKIDELSEIELEDESLDCAIGAITNKKFLIEQIKNILESSKLTVYSVYTYVKNLLVALGIPEREIEFIHDHNGKKRAKLFERVNAGEVRILLGSTSKLGTGCNVHKNGIWALHHIDAPWRPSDIEQREGRGIRQLNGENLGKTLGTCLVFRYITERLDALRWQTLQWKQEAGKSFLNGADIDSLEDCDEVCLSFAQVKSLATGNPMLIEESNLQNELNSLLIQERSHKQNQLGLKSEIKRLTANVKEYLESIDGVEHDIRLTSLHPRMSLEKDFVAVDEDGKALEDSFFLYQDAKAKLSQAEKDHATQDIVSALKEARDQAKAVYFADKEVEDANKAELKEVNDPITAKLAEILASGSNSPVLAGEYRGLKLYAACLGQNLNYYIRGKHAYSLPFRQGKDKHISMNKSNVIATIDKVIDALPAHLQNLEEQLEQNKEQQTRFINLQGKEFAQAARLNEVQSRLLEIREIMAKEEAVLGVSSTNTESNTGNTEEGTVEFWLNDDDAIVSNDVTVSKEVVEEILAREIPHYVLETIQPQIEEYRVIALTKTLSDAADNNKVFAIAKIYRTCRDIGYSTHWQEAFTNLSFASKKIVLRVLSKLNVTTTAQTQVAA
ncbi:MAG: DEAD/DEAH box helicase family protein [Nostoc sp.]|uniref:Eco57I restriction-modification methylase domain-containing protein n=1 Tax=Nostoc sp. TaxID=1180 RepID=UPI002FF2F520